MQESAAAWFWHVTVKRAPLDILPAQTIRHPARAYVLLADASGFEAEFSCMEKI
jgi:hypothetical protein